MDKKSSSIVKTFDNVIDKIGSKLEDKKFTLYPSICGSIVFIALSIIILILMPAQIKIYPDQAITARTFPSILVYIMLCGSAINMLKDIFNLIKRKKIKSVEISLFKEIKALIILIFLTIYALLMPIIGFILSSVIYANLMLIYFRIKNPRYYLLISTLAIVIGLLFKNVLHVRLP